MFCAVGTIRSCYQQKFAIPRQPGVVPDAPAVIELTGDAAAPEAVRELEGFSHIWVLFVFHRHVDKGWNPTVRPPRLGGNRRVGVFASRAPYRPNPIGLSVVRLHRIDYDGGGVRLHVRGGDFLDATPVLDVKPYVPYSDAIPDAHTGFAPGLQPTHEVQFTPAAETKLRTLKGDNADQIRHVIATALSYNPQPHNTQHLSSGAPLATRMFDLDIRWTVENRTIHVKTVAPA